MEVRCKKPITDFDYLIMFDLASRITGVCVYDIKNRKPTFTYIIKVKGKLELPVAELHQEIDEFFKQLKSLGYNLDKCLISFEAMPVQIHGGGSTIKTFLAMARSHAILDKYIYDNNLSVYDYVGVYPVSMKSYYKHLVGASNDFKVEKEHIRDWLLKEYPAFPNLTLDESDAVFLAKTLLEVKWDKDIDEQIKQERKHKKELKMKHAIDTVEEEIKRLQSLKIKQN